MTRHLTLFAFAIFLSLNAFSQHERHWVSFSDKGGTPSALDTPLEYLSQRALDRRANQNIAIDSIDLPVSTVYKQALIALGVTIFDESKWLNGVIINVPESNATQIMSTIDQLPFVTWSEQVDRTSTKKNPVRNSNKFDWEMELKNSYSKTSNPKKPTYTQAEYGDAFNPIDMINGVPLHNDGYAGEGMLIAVLDVGFPGVESWSAFQAARSENRIKATWDFMEKNTAIYDEHGHGTSCFSQIGAYNPGTMIGTAPNADFILLVTEYPYDEIHIEQYIFAIACEYSDSAGVDVFNASLGYSGYIEYADNFSTNDLDGNTFPSTIACDISMAKGMLAVVAAGNDGSGGIGSPADADSSLTVGAVYSDGSYAGFSSVGPTADGRICPHTVAQGGGGVLATANGTTTSNGTSFASPIIAGMSACLWQKHPCATAMEIRNAVMQSGSQASNPDNILGHGIPDYEAASQILGPCAITDAPIADFSASKTSICVGETTDFSDESLNYPDTWNWTFTGGTPANSTSENPSVAYSSSGVYEVSLTATNIIGNNSTTKTGYISVGQGGTLPLIEGFEGSFTPSGWVIDNPDGSITWQQRTDIGNNSSSSMIIDNTGYSDVGQIDEITAKAVDLSNAVSPVMTFDVAYTKFDDSSPDILKVFASNDCGITWGELYNKTHTELETVSVPTNESNDWEPTQAGDWRNELVDLSAYEGDNYVQVKFQNTTGYGTRVWIDNVNITYPTLSVSPVKQIESSLTIYPNPNNGLFRVDLLLNEVDNYQIDIRNVLGQKVYVESLVGFSGSYSKKIDLSILNDGLYFITIKGNNIQLTEKLIKK